MTSEIKFIRDNPHMSISAMADFLGRGYNSVWDAVRRYGIKKKLRPYKEWTAKEVRELIKMRKQGLTYSQISEKIGRSAKNCRGAYQRAMR